MKHVFFAALLLAASASAQVLELDETCTVAILNRSVQVGADGSWVLPNVPTNIGLVRARATCIENGVTRSGQSDYFAVPPNGVVSVPTIRLDQPVAPIPASIALVSPVTLLTTVGASVQVSARATYANGTVVDLSQAAQGTNWFTSNPRIATVSPNGLITAISSGTALISAMNEGALGMVSIGVTTSGDSDGDGLPDQFELDNGLNPNNPADAQTDLDGDGLTNLQEFNRGTDLRNADTDADGLNDGAEVARATNPLLPDTDGDGVRDGLEVQTGSNPLDPSSVNLAQALNSISIAPGAFEIVVNTILGEGSRRVTVTGALKDGTTIDLTARSRGTNYVSSSLAVASFGAIDGQIFGGANGTATITVTNGGHSATASVTVRSFAPQSLAMLPMPGFANNVDVSGNYAYVAAGSTGLVVVDVTNRRAPSIAGTLDTPGNANDVRVVGKYAYVADGAAGLQIIDVTNPGAPHLVGTVDTPGTAWDVVVSGDRAFIADGASGLQIADCSNPLQPRLIGSLDTAGTAKGVDVNGSGIAVVADGGPIRIIDVSNPTAPSLLSSVATAESRDVTVDGQYAYVADFGASIRVVHFLNPSQPALIASTAQSQGGIVTDVAKAGALLFASDVLFVNGVSITSVAVPASPVVRARLDFPQRDDNGTGIAADHQFVYLTAEAGSLGTENGTSGTTALYIGQYLVADDTGGIQPVVQLTAPIAQPTVIERSTLRIAADASDDVLVASVDFLVNGVVVATDSSEPYETSYRVPAGLTTIAIQARATDVGGNSATTPQVILSVLPDPGTTAAGRVLTETGGPANGAQVSCNGAAGIAAADGSFSVSGVPTVDGPIVCRATWTGNDNVVRTGFSSAAVAVVAGTTNVGTFSLSQSVFPPMPGVLALFDFDGNVNDTSGNGRNASLIGGVFVTTPWGQGLRIDGNQHGLDWTAFASQLTHPFTVEMILTPTSDTGGYRKLFSFNDGSDTGWYYHGGGFNSYPFGEMGGGTMPAGQRHYLAFVSLTSSTMDVYFQGRRIGSIAMGFTPPPPHAVFFRDDTATGRNEQFTGTVEALRISGVARTAAEIDQVQQRLITR